MSYTNRIRLWSSAGAACLCAFAGLLPAGTDSPATIANQDSGGMGQNGAGFLLGLDTIAQQAYLKASNPEEDDDFGWTVAISGDMMMIGAPYEDSNARREWQPERQQRRRFRCGLHLRAQRDELEPASLSQSLKHRCGRPIRRLRIRIGRHSGGGSAWGK